MLGHTKMFWAANNMFGQTELLTDSFFYALNLYCLGMYHFKTQNVAETITIQKKEDHNPIVVLLEQLR